MKFTDAAILALLSANALAAQDSIRIYKGPDWFDPNPRTVQDVQIWTRPAVGSGCATDRESDCAEVRAQDIAGAVDQAVDVVGEQVGQTIRRRGGTTDHVLNVGTFPYTEGAPHAQYDGRYRIVKLQPD